MKKPKPLEHDLEYLDNDCDLCSDAAKYYCRYCSKHLCENHAVQKCKGESE